MKQVLHSYSLVSRDAKCVSYRRDTVRSRSTPLFAFPLSFFLNLRQDVQALLLLHTRPFRSIRVLPDIPIGLWIPCIGLLGGLPWCVLNIRNARYLGSISTAEMVEGKTVNNVNFGNATKGQRIATAVAGGIFSLIASLMILVMGLSMLKMDRAKAKWRVKLQAAFSSKRGSFLLGVYKHILNLSI